MGMISSPRDSIGVEYGILTRSTDITGLADNVKTKCVFDGSQGSSYGVDLPNDKMIVQKDGLHIVNSCSGQATTTYANTHSSWLHIYKNGSPYNTDTSYDILRTYYIPSSAFISLPVDCVEGDEFELYVEVMGAGDPHDVKTLQAGIYGAPASPIEYALTLSLQYIRRSSVGDMQTQV